MDSSPARHRVMNGHDGRHVAGRSSLAGRGPGAAEVLFLPAVKTDGWKGIQMWHSRDTRKLSTAYVVGVEKLPS